MSANHSAASRPAPLRVFSFDEHIVVREGMHKLLESARIQVSGTAGSLAELFQKIDKQTIDVLLVEPSQNGNRNRSVLEEILSHDRNARVLVYSAHQILPFVAAAYETGAKGFVSKTADRKILVDAIVAVAQGGTYFMPGFSEKIALFATNRRYKTDPRQALNEREIAIFTMLSAGKSTQEIANAIGVRIKVVQNCAVTIKHKLGVQRDNFTRLALIYDLITESDLISEV